MKGFARVQFEEFFEGAAACSFQLKFSARCFAVVCSLKKGF